MEINMLASGSTGNSLTISDGTSSLMLDAGLPYSKLSKKVKVSGMAGILITHEHQDHAAAAEELLRRGHKVYMSRGTWEALTGEDRPLSAPILAGHGAQFELASWVVLPFKTNHDCSEPLGFLLQSTQTGEKAVYFVDTGIIDYSFSGVHYWLVEANYEDQLLAGSRYHPALRRRIRANHFSLENLRVFLGTSDLSVAEAIYLLHVSDTSGHEALFRREIQALTGIPTYSINEKR